MPMTNSKIWSISPINVLASLTNQPKEKVCQTAHSHFTLSWSLSQDRVETSKPQPNIQTLSTEWMESNRMLMVILSFKYSVKGKLPLIWFGLSTGAFLRNYHEQTVAATQGLSPEGGASGLSFTPFPTVKCPSGWVTFMRGSSWSNPRTYCWS